MRLNTHTYERKRKKNNCSFFFKVLFETNIIYIYILFYAEMKTKQYKNNTTI